MWEEEDLAKEVAAAMGPVAMDDGWLEHHGRERMYSTGEWTTQRPDKGDEGSMWDRSLGPGIFLECDRDTVVKHCMRRERHDGPHGRP